MRSSCWMKAWLGIMFVCLGSLSLSAARVANINVAQKHEYQTNNLYEPGQVLHGHVSLEEASGTHTVELIWRDAFNRVAGSATVTVSPPVTAAEFTIKLSDPLSFANRIEAVLDGKPQLETADFCIRPLYKKWDDYYSMVWAGYEYEYFPALREAGINTHMVYKDFPYYQQVTDRNFESYVDNICWRVFAPYHKWRHRWSAAKQQAAEEPYNTARLIRDPCFNDPATADKIRNIVQQVVSFHRPHRPLFYNLADEIGIGDQSGPIDFCHSIYCRDAFIQFLKDKYVSLEALNREWGTDLESFYQAGNYPTMTDATMDRLWEIELPRAFPTVEACAERFGLKLKSFADYVALNARLKSTPPRSAEQMGRMLRPLRQEFGLAQASGVDLAAFAEKFNEWSKSLDNPDPRGWNLSPWVDHKAFMDQTLANALDLAYKYGKQADPEGTFGFTGGHSPGAFAGYNMELLSRVVDLMVPYNLSNDVEILRSLNKKMILISPTWGTDERGVRALWYQFFHNDHGIIFWDNDERANKFIEKSTGELTARARNFQPDLHELTEGVGKLILGSERLHDRIAVHYSHPSIQVHWMLQHLNLGREWILRESWHEFRDLYPNQVRSGWLKLIEDHFFQYDFVSYTQLEQGKLDSGEYDLLVLPQSVAMSRREAEAVERFVASGGTVVADCRCALSDESGKFLEGGMLDQVFGIRSESPRGEVNRVSPSGAKAINLAGVTAYLNLYGKGKAVYLNRTVNDYRFQRLKPGSDTQLFGMFSALMETLGRVPPARITRSDGSRLAGTELVRYRNGDQTIYALLKNPQTRIEGTGGEEQMDNSAFEKPERISLRLSRPSQVYDVREKKYLGQGSVFTLQLDPWRPTILVLSNRKYEPLKVTCPETNVPAGRKVNFTIALSGSGTESRYTKHIVNIKVLDPEGRRLYQYDSNLCFAGGLTEYSLPLAQDEAPGAYTVEFSETGTGLSSKQTLQVTR